MSKDYRTQSLSKWTIKQLKDEYQSLYEAVYVLKTYRTNELILLDMVEEELDRRGYEIQSEANIVKVKE